MTPESKAALERIKKDPKLRREAARRSHLFFFHAFLGERHIKYATAPFQVELFKLAEASRKYLVVEAFRGSAKSTIFALSYPIWAIIGKERRKFVVILCKTQAQARQTMKNIIDELTDNALLKKELGPFDEPDDEWRQTSIVIPRYGARITAVSLDTSVRGLKHGSHRPDVVVLDDLEDLTSVKSKDNRDKLYNQLFGDIAPMGDIGTKIVVIGTRVHDDGLIMRLRQDIDAGRLDGIFRSYPLVDDQGRIAWPGKFPNMAAIESLHKGVSTEQAWSREYLLKILDDEETVVRRDWIKRYQAMPPLSSPDFHETLTGVDLAISEETKADCTAAVSISLFRDRDGNWRAYVHPFPLNERLTYPDTRQRLKLISQYLGQGRPTPLFIESVQYQRALPQDLRHDGFPAEEFKVHGQDKRQRLTLITHLIKEGVILFPEEGCEELLLQLVNFGAERHDDLADAFAIAAHIVMERMTANRVTIPLQKPLNGRIDEQAAKENDTWFENIKEAWRQGRIPPLQYFDAQDKHRKRKIEIETQEVRERQARENDRIKETMRQYERNQFHALMRRRRFGY
jgi:phage terminase large subunit-like protein